MAQYVAPEGATWVVFDADGNVVEYSTEPIVLEMTTFMGEAVAEATSNQEQ